MMKHTYVFSAVTLAVAVSGLMLSTTGCAVAPAEEGQLGSAEEALTGGAVAYWEDNSDYNNLFGIPLKPAGSSFTPTCFLSGVVGNLGVGLMWQNYFDSPHTGPARVTVSGGSSPTLTARGGFYINQAGTPTFVPTNKVGGQATCVNHPWAAGATIGGLGESLNTYADELITVALSTRQCFLSGLVGGEGNWTSANSYARVEKRVSASWPHLTHWWLEASVPMGVTNNWPSVSATCVDFPSGTQIWTSLPNQPPNTPVVGPADVQIASGSTVLDAVACGITGIEGALHTDSYTSGVYLKSPTETDNGTWRLVVSSGKKATFACAQ